jgi:hypothetical protein
MNKELHLEYLRSKYIDLSRQYLNELHAGKTIKQLKDLAEVIGILIKEIEQLESAHKPDNDML